MTRIRIAAILASILFSAGGASAQILPGPGGAQTQTITVQDSSTECSVAGTCAQWTIPLNVPSITIQAVASGTWSGTVTVKVTAGTACPAVGGNYGEIQTRNISTGTSATTFTTTGNYTLTNVGVACLRIVGTTVAAGGLNLSVRGGSATSAELYNVSPILNIVDANTFCLSATTKDSYIQEVGANNVGFYSGATNCASGTLRFDYNGTRVNSNDIPFQASRPSIATTATDGVILSNATAATSGVTVQYSPRIRLTGSAWNSSGLASQTDSFAIENRPATVAGTTTARLAVASSINGGVYSDNFYIFSDGSIQAGGTVTSGLNVIIPAAQYLSWNARGRIYSNADNQWRFVNDGNTVGFGLQGGTADTMIVANAAQNAYGTADALAYKMSAKVTFSGTAPTATTFCTSPSVPASNGTAAFTINVGTSCATSVGTITLPTATTGWVVNCHNVTANAANVIGQTGGTTTTATITNYARTTGNASNWTDSNILRCTAVAY